MLKEKNRSEIIELVLKYHPTENDYMRNSFINSKTRNQLLTEKILRYLLIQKKTFGPVKIMVGCPWISKH